MLQSTPKAEFRYGKTRLIHDDCMLWLANRSSNSIHAVVTDPPFGLIEYGDKEQAKLRSGSGGIWRIPPSFDGNKRAPLPRFTVLSKNERRAIEVFFEEWGRLVCRVLVPGGHAFVACNPLLQHLVASALEHASLENRGVAVRLVTTMRGGDRPKHGHELFPDVSVMPRSAWEPWIIVRKPTEGPVKDNLLLYGTGGLRRPTTTKPFSDVIPSGRTPRNERNIAPHPSLKPQAFMRSIVRASLPLGCGVILDPFAGSGSTLAAANAIGYKSIGIERDPEYFELAKTAIPQLTRVKVGIDLDVIDD